MQCDGDRSVQRVLVACLQKSSGQKYRPQLLKKKLNDRKRRGIDRGAPANPAPNTSLKGYALPAAKTNGSSLKHAVDSAQPVSDAADQPVSDAAALVGAVSRSGKTHSQIEGDRSKGRLAGKAVRDGLGRPFERQNKSRDAGSRSNSLADGRRQAPQPDREYFTVVVFRSCHLRRHGFVTVSSSQS